MPPDRRAQVGQALNAVKSAVADAVAAKNARFETASLDAALVRDVIDATLPPRPEAVGRIHPISQTIDEMVAIFCEMGFAVAEGPEASNPFRPDLKPLDAYNAAILDSIDIG